MKKCSESMFFHIMLLACFSHVTSAQSEPQQQQQPATAQVNRCRQGCLYKFQTEDLSCLQGPACALCWDQCSTATATPAKINTSIQETWPLKTMAMIRQGSLVSADIAWPSMDVPSQCLVTWEVFGGGLMGNLLTDSSTVQLSLWPETKYRVQVTCKNKVTESMVRSKALTVDTSMALHLVRQPSTTSTTTTTTTTTTTPVISSSSPNSANTVSSTATEKTHLPSELDQLEEEIRQNEILSNDLKSREGGSARPRPSHVNSVVQIPDSRRHQSQYKSAAKKESDEVVTLYESRKEITLGICAAFSVFLVIVILFMIKLNRTRPVDKETLIDNEYDVSFLPPPLPDNSTQTIHV